MQIILASNVTAVTLTNVETNSLFSLAGNMVHGSTGLTANWLCKYDYHATPTELQFLSVLSLSTNSIVIQWARLQCDINNRARVLRYIIHCLNNHTGKSLYEIH